MKRLIASLLFVLAIASPVFAQDTEVPPTVEVATLAPEVTETAAPEPTAVPTEEPAPVPPVIDEAAIPSWVFVVIVVLAAGGVSIAIVAITQQAKSWPPAAREIFLSLLNTGVGELDKVAVGTETNIDNAAVAELRKLVARLEAELRATQAEVNLNAENIAATNKVVAQTISNG